MDIDGWIDTPGSYSGLNKVIMVRFEMTAKLSSIFNELTTEGSMFKTIGAVKKLVLMLLYTLKQIFSMNMYT